MVSLNFLQERKNKEMQEVEFVVEDSKLFILQSRLAL